MGVPVAADRHLSRSAQQAFALAADVGQQPSRIEQLVAQPRLAAATSAALPSSGQSAMFPACSLARTLPSTQPTR
jgi:hypothetical protein